MTVFKYLCILIYLIYYFLVCLCIANPSSWNYTESIGGDLFFGIFGVSVCTLLSSPTLVVVFVQVPAFMQYFKCSKTRRSRNRTGTVLISKVSEQAFREACVLLRGVKLPLAHNSNHVCLLC